MNIRNILSAQNNYPYTSLSGKASFVDYLFLKVATSSSFPKMSLIPYMKSYAGLTSDEEFIARYEASRIGFESMWHSRPRTNQADIEHFYLEHDKDLWRQVYLSKHGYLYKKKILSVYHAIRASVAKSDPVLDYGCGAGAVGHYMRMKGYTHVDAADIPSKTLEFVENVFKDTFTHIMTIDGSELKNGEKYGAITALDCLEHTLNPLEITKRLVANLKQGGVFVVTFPVETDFTSTHTKEAQIERPAVFEYLRKECDELVPEFIYQKK